MKRHSVFLLIALGSAASALAAAAPGQHGGPATHAANVTVIEKNQAFPLIGPFVVEDCADADCALTPG